MAELWEAVEMLRPSQKDVFIYCKLEGHTLEETAAHFNLRLTAVNGRLCRAREAIRRLLGEEPKEKDFIDWRAA